MKRNGDSLKRTVIMSVLVILISLSLAGTVAAADTQTSDPIGPGNITFPAVQVHDRMVNGSMVRGIDGHRGMWGAYPAGTGGAMMLRGGGIIHAAFMGFIAILAVVLLLVWLAVGVLLIVLLLKKLDREKTK